MYTTNQALTSEKTTKKYLNEISSDGIWKNLKLQAINFNDEKNQLEFEFLQESTGCFHTQRFKAPVVGPDVNPIRTEIQIGEIEHMFGAFVPSNYNPETRKDEKWGTTAMQASSFKEFCKFYIDKINVETTPLVNLKQLYSKDVVILEPGKTGTPFKVTGNTPFISSDYTPAVLSIAYDTDIKRGKYQKHLTFTVEYAEAPIVEPSFDNFSAITAEAADDLPF